MISEENRKKEQDIIFELQRNIDKKESIIFNAGAGAGKTHALVECLKYIVDNYGKNLETNNQKVMCITYTNVAANHIKSQIGNSELVKVSTIHERVWKVIQSHQSELLKLHIEKMENEIKDIENTIATVSKYSFYQKLSTEEKNQFKELVNKLRSNFYASYNLTAKLFKENMKEVQCFPGALDNVANFKSLVGKLYKITRYSECLENISDKKENYRNVTYDAKYNVDRLERMRISHDTVLEYGFELVNRYPLMKQIIIDQYPFILIDEYQDTSEIVIEIMSKVDEYAKELGHNICVVYFGDSVQNIYNDGVGKELSKLHKNLIPVNKEFNRRSFEEIIQVANKIRNDEIIQKSIFKDSTGGSVIFYTGGQENVEEFIERYATKWNVTKEKPLHCFFTTNQLVVQYTGFPVLYGVIKKSELYTGANYEQLNGELLGKDYAKLGKVPAFLYRMLQLCVFLKNEKTPLRYVLTNEEWRNLDIVQIRCLINLLKEAMTGNTLDELMKNVDSKYKNADNEFFRKIIDKIADLEEAYSYDGIKKFLMETLYPSVKEELDVDNETNHSEKGVQDLLNISMKELENWYYYIEDKNDSEKIYHTYHGTKGLEYENVIIVMGKNFGVRKNFFEDFFRNYNCNLDIEQIDNYEAARNLLYVAVTRAIKNLRILYIDDVEDIKDNLINIFGKIEIFQEGVDVI